LRDLQKEWGVSNWSSDARDVSIAYRRCLLKLISWNLSCGGLDRTAAEILNDNRIYQYLENVRECFKRIILGKSATDSLLAMISYVRMAEVYTDCLMTRAVRKVRSRESGSLLLNEEKFLLESLIRGIVADVDMCLNHVNELDDVHMANSDLVASFEMEAKKLLRSISDCFGHLEVSSFGGGPELSMSSADFLRTRLNKTSDSMTDKDFEPLYRGDESLLRSVSDCFGHFEVSSSWGCPESSMSAADFFKTRLNTDYRLGYESVMNSPIEREYTIDVSRCLLSLQFLRDSTVESSAGAPSRTSGSMDYTFVFDRIFPTSDFFRL
jgi:hypothetical protein